MRIFSRWSARFQSAALFLVSINSFSSRLSSLAVSRIRKCMCVFVCLCAIAGSFLVGLIGASQSWDARLAGDFTIRLCRVLVVTPVQALTTYFW
jgi:hypothetical protein